MILWSTKEYNKVGIVQIVEIISIHQIRVTSNNINVNKVQAETQCLQQPAVDLSWEALDHTDVFIHYHACWKFVVAAVVFVLVLCSNTCCFL